MKVLLVEDDVNIAAGLVPQLEQNGWEVTLARTLREAQALLPVAEPQLILLDRMLPDGDGLTWLQTLRSGRFSRPVIVLTAKAELNEKIEGLDTGADDYLTKPFEVPELLARMRARLRKTTENEDALDALCTCGSLALNPILHEVRWRGTAIALTPMEFRLLHYFLENRRRALSRETILQKVWGLRYGTTRTVDVHVGQLRQKLMPDWFQTLHGVGYRFVGEEGGTE